MYSRVTLLEIDTMRIDTAGAVELFRKQILPRLREQEGFLGVYVMGAPEGRCRLGVRGGSVAVVLVIVPAVALGAVAALALRNRVFLRLGARNVSRRPARTALIVLGLMLGTAIISSALSTGDTMSNTIRSSVIDSLGQPDAPV